MSKGMSPTNPLVSHMVCLQIKKKMVMEMERIEFNNVVHTITICRINSIFILEFPHSREVFTTLKS